MKYSIDIYDEAVDRLKEKHNICDMKVRERRDSFAELNPRFAEIDSLLLSTASRLFKAVRSENGREEFERIRKENGELQKERADLLIKAGLEPTFLDSIYNCDKCKDELYIDGKMCNCLKEELKSVAYDRFNSSSPLKLMSFDDFSLDYYSDEYDEKINSSPRKNMESVYNYVKKYSKRIGEKPESLLFTGGTGLGKTHLSLAVAKEAIEQGMGVVYDSVATLMTKLESERFGKGCEGTMDSVCESDLLILDDLGAEHITQSTKSFLYTIINTRIMAGLSTIISTNCTPSQIINMYSDAIYSRLSGDYTPIVFYGSDIRAKKRYKD